MAKSAAICGKAIIDRKFTKIFANIPFHFNPIFG